MSVGAPVERFEVLVPGTTGGAPGGSARLSALPAVPTVIHLFTG